MRIYVSGPYSSDPIAGTNNAIHAGNVLLDAGHSPFIPHLSHYWHLLHTPRHYEDWMRIDLAWAGAADLMIRLPGESSGSDREVAYAQKLSIPVFFGTAEEWISSV